MEFVITTLVSAFVGYMVNKLEKIEAKIDLIEIDIAVLKSVVPKRKEDNQVVLPD